MKKKYFISGTLMTLGIVGGMSGLQVHASTAVPVYRLYNKNTGEHFYTKNASEKNSLKIAGWKDEGLGWKASTIGTPVYRLYNPNAKGGDHYYTLSKFEAKSLIKNGWRWDNKGQAAFYSGGSANLYVAYNPNASSGAHNYTTNTFEQNSLLKGGWKYGAVAWKTMGTNDLPLPTVKPTLKVKNSVLNTGSSWSAKDNFVDATDIHGKRVDFSKVKVKGTVDTQTSGIYTITYSYEGVESKATINVRLVSTVKIYSGGDMGAHKKTENRSMEQSPNSATGVYLQKGESITISSPDYKNLKVVLGQLGSYSYLNQGKQIEKQNIDLTQEKQKITADKGDSEVWIVNKSEIATTATIEGGKQMPLFIKGETTDTEFKKQINTLKKAPFIQISGENALVNFQYKDTDKILKKISAQNFIEMLDKVVKYEYEVKGSRKDVNGSAHRYNDRLLFETPDNGAGWAYATSFYVSFQKNTGAMTGLANATINQNEWGIYHEVGHTFQDPYQKWNGMNVEVTNNIACEYILEKLGLPPVFVSGTNRYNSVKSYMSIPIAQRKWSALIKPTDNDAKLGLFHDLAVAFGEYFYPRLNQAYREMTLSNEAIDDPQLFIKTASTISKYDLRPFFKEWGLDITEETNNWFKTQTFKTLDKEIWTNSFNYPNELKEDQVPPYTIPTMDLSKEVGEYVLGSENVSDYANKGFSLPTASKITSSKGMAFPTAAVDGLTNGQSVVGVTLTNEAGVSNTIQVPVKVKVGNAISLFGFKKSQERVVLTLQKNSKQLKVLSNIKYNTIIDSGKELAYEVIHYDKNGKKLDDVSVNQDKTPENFVKQLNEVSYSEGDYFKIYNHNAGATQSYKESNIDLKKEDSKNTEIFKIENNTFARVPVTKILTTNFRVNVGESVEAKDVIQTDAPSAVISFETYLDVSRALEGKAKVKVTPSPWLGASFVSEVPYQVVHNNDLSLYGYLGTQERISVSLQKDKKIRVLKNPFYDTVMDSGSGKTFGYTHYDKALTVKETSTLNKEETPDKFVSEIDGKNYEDGDLIQIQSTDKGRIVSYQNGKVDLNKEKSGQEAWFKISGNNMIYAGTTQPKN